MNSPRYGVGKRIADALTMFVVMGLSLLCLVYVAHGEATRTYERFVGDKLHGQAQIVQGVMETFLQSGLPLGQFVGFSGLADQIIASDDTIAALTVVDTAGDLAFGAGDTALIEQSAQASYVGRPLAALNVIENGEAYRFGELGGFYHVTVPLGNKFENVGALIISMQTSVVQSRIETLFADMLRYLPAPAAIFALVIALMGSNARAGRSFWPQIAFAGIFLTCAGLVVAALVSLYSEGAQVKARALAQSLGQRLQDLVEFNINLAEIDGLEQTFGDYLSVNPDLSSAALTIDDRIAIHTDPSRVGLPWLVGENNYAYVVELTTPEDVRSVKVAVEMPHGVVVDQIVRSVKNFAALFIASAFLANLFFQVGGAVRQNPGREDRVAAAPEHHAQLVNYLNPVFFLAVLSEHLSYAFLPQFVRDIAAASGVPDGWTTAPFVIYYAVFALTLLPAGYVAQRTSPRPMMYLGLLVAAGSMFALSEAQDFWTVLAARAGAGLGQGLIFIGVQNYLLAVSSPNHKTQAAAVIVYGFQGGMISGMAVGSLLVGTMGRDGVFGLAAVIAAVAAVYTLMTVPVLSRAALAAMSSGSTSGLGRGVMLSLGDRHFMTAMLSIGMPAKAVLTGVVTFGLPLLLTSMMYPQEDIGQLIMIYALAVVISSRVIAPKVDRLGDSQSALFHGTILSGLGLMVMAASGLYEPALTAAYGGSAATVVLAVGIALVGVAHGFINAPVVTFVAGSRLASRIGAGAATSTYRFLERIGHVAGPMIVAQLFVLFADDWSAIAAAGAGVLFLGMVFFMVCASARESRSPGVDPSPENTPV